MFATFITAWTSLILFSPKKVIYVSIKIYWQSRVSKECVFTQFMSPKILDSASAWTQKCNYHIQNSLKGEYFNEFQQFKFKVFMSTNHVLGSEWTQPFFNCNEYTFIHLVLVLSTESWPVIAWQFNDYCLTIIPQIGKILHFC